VSQQLTPVPAAETGEILADCHRLPQTRTRTPATRWPYVYRPGDRRKSPPTSAWTHGWHPRTPV
jgi:hypothetical protein